LLSFASVGQGERIKDIIDIQGVRGNPLTGIGLVVGLADTGDKAKPSQQMLASLLSASGVVISPRDIAGGSIAVVVVTAELGAFARKGSRIDVDVSAVGDAESLQGGMLLPTLLKGLDEQVYAVGQGPVSIGGWAASGDRASITRNHQTVGRIPGGAIVEREEIATFVEHIAGHTFVTLNLRNNDFSTAERISRAINQIHPDSSAVIDAGTIKVQIPDEIGRTGVVGFIDDITSLQVEVDAPAVVVINERTGTIVVGEKVGISTVAISQGSLVVNIKEMPIVSQPVAPFSDAGETVVVEDTMIGVEEEEGYLIPVSRAVTVSDLAKTLNAIGATPRDLIAIFNALKKAGALQANLVIM
jgi:flagellar P-ring protein precursor FlgI